MHADAYIDESLQHTLGLSPCLPPSSPNHRSCRASLEAHNARRRKRERDREESADSDGTGGSKQKAERRRQHRPHMRRNILAAVPPDAAGGAEPADSQQVSE
jgi:hypothetical protein